MAGLITPDRPHLSVLDPILFLAFAEAIVCETESGARAVQGLYDDASPGPAPEPRATGEARRAQIAAFVTHT